MLLKIIFIFVWVMLGLLIIDQALMAQPQPVVKTGFPLYLEGFGATSYEGPTVADLDGDGQKEIILANGRKVHVLRADGTALAGWPRETLHDAVNSPAVGDVDGDKLPEVVALCRRQVYIWDFRGNLLPGFPLQMGRADCAVALYDLDNDGDLEIIGEFGGKVHAIHHDGTSVAGWPQELPGFAPNSKVAVGDVNGDGIADIFIAAADTTSIDPFYDRYGRLYAWNARGEPLPGWPVTTPRGYYYAFGCNPILVDLDGDGLMEIAVGTRKIQPNSGSAYFAVYYADGEMMAGWPQYTYAGESDSLMGFQSGPAAADLDADGLPELIVCDSYGHLVIWEGNGVLVPNWPPARVGPIYSNPTVGDIDGDGYPEIIVPDSRSQVVSGSWRGFIHGLAQEAGELAWSPLFSTGSTFYNAIALDDLENDGNLELIAIGTEPFYKKAWLNVWEIPGVPFTKKRFPWPMFAHDRWHTSQYGFELPDEPVVSVKHDRENFSAPEQFVLGQNFPNPYPVTAGGTEIRFRLPAPSPVQLHIYNVLGERIRSFDLAYQPAGEHKIHWNGRDTAGILVAPGVYFYRLIAVDRSEYKKMIVIR